MADNKPKFDPKLIAIKRARLAFARIHKAEARKDKNGNPKGEPKYSGTLLLDPSNKDSAAEIALIKSESVRALNHRYGEGKFNVQMLEDAASGKKTFPNFHLCWGYGNDLPALGKKLYDGFKDMFYLKLSDKNRPNLLNRAGNAVIEGDPECPYAGCYVAGTTTLYSYDNESRGVNANLRTLVYTGKGQAFGGGAPDAASEYAALGVSAADGDGPTESPFAGESKPVADPFAIAS
jgi:hypothetical protein